MSELAGGDSRNIALTSDAEVIPADVPLAGGGLQTFQTSDVLQPGTYLVTASLSLQNTSGGTIAWDFLAGLGTAAGQILGSPSASGSGLVNGGSVTAAVDFLAVITAAGTLIFSANPAGAATAKATSRVAGSPGATGYAAVKIA